MMLNTVFGVQLAMWLCNCKSLLTSKAFWQLTASFSKEMRLYSIYSSCQDRIQMQNKSSPSDWDFRRSLYHTDPVRRRFLSKVGLVKDVRCGDPTDGFTPVPLTEQNFFNQWPFNLQLDTRYSYVDGVRRLWVYSNDKPYAPNSPTKPRSEIRMKGYDYSSGVWQFEAYAYVPTGTSGVSIMQIFGADSYATTIMLRVYSGALRYYDEQVIEDDIYNRWFRVNVIHNVGAKQVQVFIDGELKLTVADRGGSSHYFKFGVYTQIGSSNYMESHWKGVKIWKLSN